MSYLAKQLTLTFLSPWAALAGLVIDPLWCTWAHARLAAKIHTTVDPSVVILNVPKGTIVVGVPAMPLPGRRIE